MFANKRGDAAILFSLGVSLLIFGYIAILQVIQSNAIKINIKNMLALDGFLTSEIYAWQGFLTKKRQESGFSVSIDSTQTKYYTNGANFCGSSLGGSVCLGAKESAGSTGGAWEQVNTSGAPTGFIPSGFDSVWTGSKLVVWDSMNNVGGIFDPSTNQWKAMSPAPAEHIGTRGRVWTGDKMFVYGYSYAGTYDPKNISSTFFDHPVGCFAYTYSPDTNKWTSQRLELSGQYYPDLLCRYPLAVKPLWTGSKAIVMTSEYSWGKFNNIMWSIDPLSNSATQLSAVPSDFPMVQGVSSGKKWLFYTCSEKRGYTFDSDSNNWLAISKAGAPGCGTTYNSGATLPLSIGDKVIYWYGTEGGIYNPSSDSWEQMGLAKAPEPRSRMLAVWTGTKMVVWGGSGDCMNTTCATGGIYDSIKKTWSPTSNTSSPKATSMLSAAWVGDRALVWGGTYSYIDQTQAKVYTDVPSYDTFYFYPNGK